VILVFQKRVFFLNFDDLYKFAWITIHWMQNNVYLVYQANLGPVVGQFILFDIMIPIIKPKRPRAEAKICTINMETKVLGV